MSLPTIKLGLVGGISHTAMPLLNALIRQQRLQLMEVYDSRLAAAKENAQHLHATYSQSLDGLLRRCQGVVFGEVNWMGNVPILRSTGLQRPSLVLQSVYSRYRLTELLELQSAAREHRCLVMPELSYRWARSTLRLRELTATQAGAIEYLEFQCHGEVGTASELLAHDWCCNVMQSECRSVVVDSDTGAITLKFRRMNRDGEPVTARILFHAGDHLGDFSSSSAMITCRHGNIRLSGDDKISWDILGKKSTETLNRDRTAHDVMFDLFGRRLVGGLVPVPEIADLIKAHEIHQAVIKSRELQTEVIVDHSLSRPSQDVARSES